MSRRMLSRAVLTAFVVTALAVPAGLSGRRSVAAPAAPFRYQTNVLVRGSPIHGANGLAIDAQGRLLVASAYGGELLALNPDTGQILQRLGHSSGVDGPDDVATGPDGSIYWTDIFAGQVGRLAPDGTVKKQTVAAGVNPIAFSPDGRLFVGQAFFGSGLYEVDPNFVQAPTPVIASSGGPTFPQQLNGFDFGPDGMLYAPQPFLGRIVKVDPATGAMTLVTDEFAGLTPSSVEFDHHGQLYVSLEGGTVVRLNPDTGAYTVIARFPHAGIDNMVFDARDRLYVSNNTDGSIFEVEPGGGVRTLSPGGLILPGGVALTAGASGRDSLFVADSWSLGEFDPISGRLLGSDRQSLDWMQPGLDRSNAGIMGPWTVSPDNGNLILSNWLASAVQIWNPATHQAEAVHTEFPAPLNAIRFQGDLVVVQFPTRSVVRESPGGIKSTIFTSPSGRPAGLAATNSDLWVSDRPTGKVWKVVSDGTVLSSPQLTAQGLQLPEGMAVDRDGSLLVVEAGAGRLSRIDPATGDVTPVAEGLGLGLQGSAAAPGTWALSSVAVGQNGTLFVTGDIADVVYRLLPVPPS